MNLRNEYELLRWMEEEGKREGWNVNKFLEKKKKEIRAYLKTYIKDVTDPSRWHYSEDGEHRWCKHYFSEPFTEEEKREWIRDEWWHINSPYDCTGQWFTFDISICNLKDGTSVMYHRQGLDV